MHSAAEHGRYGPGGVANFAAGRYVSADGRPEPTPGEDGMTPGIFDQLSPGDRLAHSAAFGCYGEQSPRSRDDLAEVVR